MLYLNTRSLFISLCFILYFDWISCIQIKQTYRNSCHSTLFCSFKVIPVLSYFEFSFVPCYQLLEARFLLPFLTYTNTLRWREVEEAFAVDSKSKTIPQMHRFAFAHLFCFAFSWGVEYFKYSPFPSHSRIAFCQLNGLRFLRFCYCYYLLGVGVCVCNNNNMIDRYKLINVKRTKRTRSIRPLTNCAAAVPGLRITFDQQFGTNKHSHTRNHIRIITT